MENTNRGVILGRVLIVLAVVVVCLSIGLSVYFLTSKSESFTMKFVNSGENVNGQYVNVGESFDIEVIQENASDEKYSVVSGDESIVRSDGGIPSTTDSNKKIWRFTALKGGKIEVKFKTTNQDYNGKGILIMVGAGTSQDPYYVRNDSDLANISEKAGSGVYFKQVGDISLKNTTWTAKPFTGFYDGDNHVISNLTASTGLFSKINSGSSVTKLSLTNFTINGSASNLGALAGENDGNVSLIKVQDASITGGNSSNVGGVVGLASGAVENNSWSSIIRGCAVEDPVTLSGGNVGGIVGQAQSAYLSNNYAYLKVTSGITVGGIAGAVSGNKNVVINSYAVGQGTNVSGKYIIGSVSGNNNTIGGNYVKGLARNPEVLAQNPGVLNNYSKNAYFSYNGSSIWNFTSIWEEHNNAWPTLRQNADFSNDSVTIAEQQALTIYTILFETNGGSIIGNVQISEGTSFASSGVSLNTPTKKKYLFDGWYTDSGLTQAFSDEQVITSNMVLYAKWKDNFYNVTFETKGGNAIEAIKITKEGTFNQENESLPRPVKENASFIGWFVDEEETQAFTLNTKVMGDMTVYAAWEEEAVVNMCVVTFDTNSGIAVGAMEITQGNSFNDDGYVLPETTREGYNFLGWYTDSELTQTFTPTTKVMESITLYAKWEKASIYKDIDSLNRSFAADLADDGVYNNVYNIDSNIDFAGTSWTPIGTLSQPFNGEFNFVGKISNIKIIASNGNRYVGFFGVVGNNGVVRGLELENVSIDVKNTANPVVGAIAGANLGTIENCAVSNDGNSTISVNTSGRAVVGGLVGENRNDVKNSVVSSSINVSSDQASVGGVVGSAVAGAVTNVSYAKINENNHTITVQTTKADEFDCAGGVVGSVGDGNVSKSTSNATITIVNENNEAVFVGGIVGIILDTATRQDVASVFNCSANGVDITGKTAGGIVGKAELDNAEMFDCVINSTASGKVNGEDKAGGLVGTLVRGNVKKCVTTCELSGNTVAGLAVDILRQNGNDIARVEDCLAYVTLGECEHAYYSTESKVYKVTNDWVPFGIVSQDKLAGFVENCLIVDNISADKQYGLQIGSPNTPVIGVISLDKTDSLISEASAKKANTYKGLGFDEDVWNIVDDEIPTLK